MKRSYVGFKAEEWLDRSLKGIALETKTSVSDVVRNALIPLARAYREKHGN